MVCVLTYSESATRARHKPLRLHAQKTRSLKEHNTDIISYRLFALKLISAEFQPVYMEHGRVKTRHIGLHPFAANRNVSRTM